MDTLIQTEHWTVSGKIIQARLEAADDGSCHRLLVVGPALVSTNVPDNSGVAVPPWWVIESS